MNGAARGAGAGALGGARVPAPHRALRLLSTKNGPCQLTVGSSLFDLWAFEPRDSADGHGTLSTRLRGPAELLIPLSLCLAHVVGAGGDVPSARCKQLPRRGHRRVAPGTRGSVFCSLMLDRPEACVSLRTCDRRSAGYEKRSARNDLSLEMKRNSICPPGALCFSRASPAGNEGIGETPDVRSMCVIGARAARAQRRAAEGVRTANPSLRGALLRDDVRPCHHGGPRMPHPYPPPPKDWTIVAIRLYDRPEVMLARFPDRATTSAAGRRSGASYARYIRHWDITRPPL